MKNTPNGRVKMYVRKAFQILPHDFKKHITCHIQIHINTETRLLPKILSSKRG